jgi:hypothetical protein
MNSWFGVNLLVIMFAIMFIADPSNVRRPLDRHLGRVRESSRGRLATRALQRLSCRDQLRLDGRQFCLQTCFQGLFAVNLARLAPDAAPRQNKSGTNLQHRCFALFVNMFSR